MQKNGELAGVHPVKLVKDDLFNRYVAVYDKWTHLLEKKQQVVKWMYAKEDRFDVEKYANGVLPAGGPLLDKWEPDANYKYGLDSGGRPCYMQYEANGGEIVYAGIFKCSNSCVEYVEYNMRDRKPVVIVRLLQENGRKTAYQALHINGKKLGRDYENLTGREVADKLQQMEHDIFCMVKHFQYGHDRIEKADCWESLAGVKATYYEERYQYTGTGALDEIKSVYPDGTSQLLYVKMPDNTTIEQLSDQLALQIAQSVTERLVRKKWNAPLSILQLGIHEVDDYHPHLSMLTVKEKVDILNTYDELRFEKLFILVSDDKHFRADTSYERLYTAFMGKVQEGDEWWLPANEMIYKAARLLTVNKLWNKVPVDKDFVAYAVDWSMGPNEEGEMGKLLLTCGLPAETLRKWEREGYFK
ncbi:hypothetical protein [Filimonas lacunae]|nr:hypothetical protein [Filimonas lacunae]BAV07372.1 hypothetical protein FLA_3395 [Filimonas lacunae]